MEYGFCDWFIKRSLCFSCTGLLTYVNCMKVKWGAIVQVVSTVAKVLALIVIIITGLVKLGQGGITFLSLYYVFVIAEWQMQTEQSLKKKKKTDGVNQPVNMLLLQVSIKTLKIRLKDPSWTPVVWPRLSIVLCIPTLAGTPSTSSQRRSKTQRGTSLGGFFVPSMCS